jgi:hypothetical protein
MDADKTLTDFRDFRISLQELKTAFNADSLLNEKVENPLVVTAHDVVTAIRKYRSGEIGTQTLVDWVNMFWFDDGLYDYDDSQCDSMASVVDLLEELDEDGVFYIDEEYDRMIAVLESNTEFVR